MHTHTCRHTHTNTHIHTHTNITIHTQLHSYTHTHTHYLSVHLDGFSARDVRGDGDGRVKVQVCDPLLGPPSVDQGTGCRLQCKLKNARYMVRMKNSMAVCSGLCYRNSVMCSS